MRLPINIFLYNNVCIYIQKWSWVLFFLHIYAAFHSSSSLLILKKGTKIYLRRYLLFFRKPGEERQTHSRTYHIIHNKSNISHCFCYYYYVLRFVLISPSLLGAALLPPSILKWLSGSLSLSAKAM